MNASLPKNITELLISSRISISRSLIIHDNSTDMLFNPGSSEHQFSVSLSIVMSVLNTQGFESLSDSHVRLVHCKDTFAWGADFLAGPDQFFLITVAVDLWLPLLIFYVRDSSM